MTRAEAAARRHDSSGVSHPDDDAVGAVGEFVEHHFPHHHSHHEDDTHAGGAFPGGRSESGHAPEHPGDESSTGGPTRH